MSKKMTLLGMMIAALAALVIPAAASATPQLINQTSGAAVAVGSKLMGTSSNAVTTETKLGTLTCSSVSIGAEVTKNSGTAIEAVSYGGKETNTTSGCFANGTTPVTIDEPKLTSLVTNSTTTDEGTLGLSYTATIGSGPVVCPFSGTGPFTYKTGTGNNKLVIAASKPIELSGPELCTKAGVKPKFSGEFTLELDTAGGTGAGPMDPVFVK
jgi:hypothetical protein